MRALLIAPHARESTMQNFDALHANFRARLRLIHLLEFT